MNAIEFGKFLASLRNEKGLTQEELAEILFIDKRKVSRWECGMSIPDFETIIKLSEILDVTPYEFSICKRLENEKLSKKVINKFKNIKDFKKYELKKKILIIISILLGIFFILTAIYTFKYYGKVEIYEFRSLDKKYTLNGMYVRAGSYVLYNIDNINFNDPNINIPKNLNECNFAIYKDKIRVFSFADNDNIINKNKSNPSKLFYYGKMNINEYLNTELNLYFICSGTGDKFNEFFIPFEFKTKYNNK